MKVEVYSVDNSPALVIQGWFTSAIHAGTTSGLIPDGRVEAMRLFWVVHRAEMISGGPVREVG